MTSPKYPKWFQEWKSNEFFHLARDVWWIKWLALGTFGAVITAIVTKVI